MPVGRRAHEHADGLFAGLKLRVPGVELAFHHEAVAVETPARAAPEGEAVGSALSEGVVNVSFSRAVPPVVVRETAPVGVRQEFHAHREHVGLLRRVRGGRKLSVRDVLREGRALKDVQLIAVDPVQG